MDDYIFWDDESRILAETVVCLEELQERYACHRLTTEQTQSKVKIIMKKLIDYHCSEYWKEFSEKYDEEGYFIENDGFDCEYYIDLTELEENIKKEAINYGVNIRDLIQSYENIKLGNIESKEEEEERKWYEIDKRALEDIVYYNRKCLDKFYIEERIKNYEEKQKIKEQIKEKYKSIFDAVDKLFA